MSPLLFTVPGTDWEVSAYGFFLGLALVGGWLLALRLAAKDKLPVDRLGMSFVLALAFGLFAARAAWLFAHPQTWTGLGSLFAWQQGGLSPLAGFVVALLVTLRQAERLRVSAVAWLDALAPALALGVTLERIGALLAGTGFGRYAPDSAFAIRFPPGSPAFEAHRRLFSELMPPGATESLPVYPVQVVGAVLAGAALWIALRLLKRRRYRGQVFLLTTTWLVAAGNFVEEPLRADREAASLGPLSATQAFAGVLVAALLVIDHRRRKRAAASSPGERATRASRGS